MNDENKTALLSKLRAEGVQAGDGRAAFEEWAVTEFTHPFMRPDPLIPDPDGSGDYVDHDVQLAWSGYQQARAALASAPVPPAEVLDALDWLDDFVARCNGDDRGVCESVNLLRRVLASAPVADAVPVKASNIDTRDVDVEVHAFGSIFYDHGPNLAEALGRLAQRVARWRNLSAPSLASAPVAPQACPTDVCQAGKTDGVLCANDECDRANGVRPASAPVAVRLPSRESENCGSSSAIAYAMAYNKALDDVAALNASAPVAGEAPTDDEIIDMAVEPLSIDCDRMPYGVVIFARALLARYAAPRASEPVRIRFPSHLRKMWSGGEVQAWLDEHQGITPPKPSAKGSLERYRKWQAEQAQADKDGGDCAKGAGDRLMAAAKGMTKLYPHVWDRTDGALVVFPENVARFDAAFDALRVAVGEAVEDDDHAALSPTQPTEQGERDA